MTATLLLSEEFASLDLASTTNPNGLWRPNDTWQPVDKGYLDFGAGGQSSYNTSPEESLGGTKYPLASVTDGILSLRSIRTPASAAAAAHNAPWLTSFLVSNSNRISFGYGYFEFKMRLSQWCQGGFPALWLYAASGSKGNASQSNKGGAEIDLLEVFGYSGASPWNTTLHSAGNNSGPSQIGDQSVSSVQGDTQGWHTYGIDWTADHLQFYKDGLLTGSASPAFVQWLRGLRMDIRMNVAMDAGWFPAGQRSIAAGTGVTMQIDYVRVYDSMPAATSAPTPPPVVAPAPVPVSYAALAADLLTQAARLDAVSADLKLQASRLH